MWRETADDIFRWLRAGLSVSWSLGVNECLDVIVAASTVTADMALNWLSSSMSSSSSFTVQLQGWHDIYWWYISDIFEFKNIGYFRYFQNRIFSQHYFITWCKNLTKYESRHFVFNTAYYLILKHFYRAMHVVQSAVLLLLLFLVVAFWNIQLKHKPFSWHHPIQCCKMKISKMSDIFGIFRKYCHMFHPCTTLVIESTVTSLFRRFISMTVSSHCVAVTVVLCRETTGWCIITAPS